MKRKISLLVIICMLSILSLVGCGFTCKEPGCDSEVYKEGYCQYHYGVKSAGEVVDAIGDGIMSLFE